MLKVLVFAPYASADVTSDVGAPSKRVFDICWFSIMQMGPAQAGAKGRQERKQAKRILESFRKIGQRLPNAPVGFDGRDAITLSEAGGRVALSDDDAKQLVRWIDAIPWKGPGVENAEDAVDFLDAAERMSETDVLAHIPAVAAD